MKNLKKLSLNELKSIKGGFTCSYNGTVLGEASTTQECMGMVNKHILDTTPKDDTPSGPQKPGFGLG